MDAKFDYFERESKALFGREIPQVLLIHANSLNADAYPELARMMKARGYRFVPLGEALEDPGVPLARYVHRRRRHQLAPPLGADARRQSR